MGMLDSNTDRSFFMIGAIIVAGLVIGLLVTVIGGDFSDGLSRTVNGLFDNADAIITGESGSGGHEFPLVTDADAVVISSGVMTSYTGSAREITIPTTLDGHTVTAIGTNSLLSKGDISIVFPSTLISINVAAMNSGTRPKVVDIPSGVSVHPSFGMGAYTTQFKAVYDNNGKQAGRYVWDGTTYIKQ